MVNIKLISLNVNGINILTKRHVIFDHPRKPQADVCLLQETHATDNTAKLWAREWGGKLVANNGSQSSKGVMVLLARSSTFKITKQCQDDEGRLLCMDLEINGTTY